VRPAVAESRGSSLSPLATRSFNGSRFQPLHRRHLHGPSGTGDTRDLSALSVENRHRISDTTANYSKSNIQHPTSKIPKLLPLRRVWKIASPVLRLGKCVGLLAVMLLATGHLNAQTNLQRTWAGSNNGALKTSGNWNQNTGNISVATDSVFNNNSNNASLTNTTGTVGSLNANGTSSFRIFNNTSSSSSDSTLTLGGLEISVIVLRAFLRI
jgi:hypothetical protein